MTRYRILTFLAYNLTECEGEEDCTDTMTGYVLEVQNDSFLSH